jgi:hypothetical protein
MESSPQDPTVFAKFLKIAEEEPGRRVLAGTNSRGLGILDLIMEEGFLERGLFGETLKLLLICLQSECCSQKIFLHLEKEYWINWLIDGILDAIDKNESIIDDG